MNNSFDKIFEKKIKNFQNNINLQKKFKTFINYINIVPILFPHLNYKIFPNEFYIKYFDKTSIYPILKLRNRLHYVKNFIEKEKFENKYEEKLEFWYIKKYLIDQLFYLKFFELQVKDFVKINKIKKSDESDEFFEIFNNLIKIIIIKFSQSSDSKLSKFFFNLAKEFTKIQNFVILDKILNKNKIKLFYYESIYLKNKKNNNKIFIHENDYIEYDLDYNKSNNNFDQILKEKINHEKILEEKEKIFNNELNILMAKNKEINLNIENIKKENQNIKNELSKVTEEALYLHKLNKEATLPDEYLNLKREFDLTQQKNDILVSKNIELANMLDKALSNDGLQLERILDNIKLRVNTLIRNPYTNDAEILITCLSKEISQLKRARIYLGSTLFDLGILYLKLGNRSAALIELRAARELGILEVEQLIKKI